VRDYSRDPAEIYRQSFATIRAEVDLSVIPAGAQGIAERIIHSCGMTDIIADLPEVVRRAGEVSRGAAGQS